MEFLTYGLLTFLAAVIGAAWFQVATVDQHS